MEKQIKNLLLDNPRQFSKYLLGIITITGVVVLVEFLRLPSEIEHQFLLGLSGKRLGLGVILLLILAVNIGAFFWITVEARDWKKNIEQKAAVWMTNHVTWVFMVFYIMTGLMGLLVLAVFHPAIKAFMFLESTRYLLGGPSLWLFCSILIWTVIFRISYRKMIFEDRILAIVDYFLVLALIFGFTFYSYKHILIWAGAENQKSYAYWNLLADEFLRGKLYLENPLQYHDLTLYKGRWYLPMPPLPAILMMPPAYLIGDDSLNTSYFSILFSATNAVLVFLILEQLSIRRWIKLSRRDILLLVALFLFGNPHLWVGIRGRAWFVSQIVTVTFLALAVWATFKSWSPWLVGISIGLAMTARPNAVMTWPFVFAIAMQILKEKTGGITYREILTWSSKSALPMMAAVAGLLYYNYARFENIFDFGYTTISGDPAVVANAQTYGIFSPHYIPMNLKVMLFYLPTIQLGNQWPILPSTTGMSIFLTTLPLIYLFRRYEHQWWIFGAWASVLFNFILLMLYHNTGAHQFGYRYILDAIVPLLALLAVALSEKIPWHFILLLVVSIVFNIYGAYWFING